jgi:hypothetical protein
MKKHQFFLTVSQLESRALLSGELLSASECAEWNRQSMVWMYVAKFKARAVIRQALWASCWYGRGVRLAVTSMMAYFSFFFS